MGNNSICIGAPYITRDGTYARLCSDLDIPNEGSFTLYYEVPMEYEEFLCTERVNSFVLGLLGFAMYMDYDIKSDVPLDEALHYQLTNYGSKIIADNLDFYHDIKLDVPYVTEPVQSRGGYRNRLLSRCGFILHGVEASVAGAVLI